MAKPGARAGLARALDELERAERNYEEPALATTAAASAAAQACVALASSAPPLTLSGAVRCVARMALVLAASPATTKARSMLAQRGCCTASERCALAAIVASFQEPLVQDLMQWSARAMSRWCARFLALPLAFALCKEGRAATPVFYPRGR